MNKFYSSTRKTAVLLPIWTFCAFLFHFARAQTEQSVVNQFVVVAPEQFAHSDMKTKLASQTSLKLVGYCAARRAYAFEAKGTFTKEQLNELIGFSAEQEAVTGAELMNICGSGSVKSLSLADAKTALKAGTKPQPTTVEPAAKVDEEEALQQFEAATQLREPYRSVWHTGFTDRSLPFVKAEIEKLGVKVLMVRSDFDLFIVEVPSNFTEEYLFAELKKRADIVMERRNLSPELFIKK